MSILKIHIGDMPLLLYPLISSWLRSMLSWSILPGTKAACDLSTSISMRGCNLCTSIVEIILQMVVKQKMGLQSLIDLGYFVLGMRVTEVLLIGEYNSFIVKKWRTTTIASWHIIAQLCLKKWELNPSIPRALSSAIPLRSASTSLVVKGWMS